MGAARGAAPRGEDGMSRAMVLAAVAALLGCGCGIFRKEAYLVPTPHGWVEQETTDGGNKIKYRPAERVEMKVK